MTREPADDQPTVDAVNAAAREGAEVANQLLRESKTLQVCCGVMLASWRTFMASRQVLDEHLMKLATEHGVQGVGEISKLLVASMRNAAMEPFKLEELRAQLQETVLPFIDIQLGRLQTESDIQREQILLAAEKTRREMPVNVGITFAADSAPAIPKDRSLLLVGDSGKDGSVQFVLGRMAGNVVRSTMHPGTFYAPRVLWLSTSTQAFQEERLCVLPIFAWKGLAQSRRKLDKVICETVEKHLDGKVDLIVVGDLGILGNRNVQETLEIRRAYAEDSSLAHVRISRIAKDHGAALLAGLSERHIDKTQPIDLEQYARVVHITSETQGTNVVYHIGDGETFTRNLGTESDG